MCGPEGAEGAGLALAAAGLLGQRDEVGVSQQQLPKEGFDGVRQLLGSEWRSLDTGEEGNGKGEGN